MIWAKAFPDYLANRDFILINGNNFLEELTDTKTTVSE